MAKRPAHSLLLISRRRLQRADFATRGAPSPSAHTAREPSGDPVADVTMLANLSPLGRTTTVLLEDCWLQVVELERAAIRGLDDAELATAVGYELEGLSGLSTSAGEVSVGAPLSETATVVRRIALEVPVSLGRSVRAVLADAGCRRVAITHPAALTVAEPATVSLIEVRERVTVCRTPDGGGVVIPARVGQRSWMDTIHDLLKKSGGHAFTWRGVSRPDAAGPLPTAVEDEGDLPEEQAPEQTLAAWARLLEDRPAVVPMLTRARKRLRRRPGPLAVGLVATVLTSGVLGLFVRSDLDAVTEAESRAGTVSERLRELTRAERALASTRNNVAKRGEQVNADQASLERLKSARAALRGRFAALLRALATHRTDGVVVTSVEGRPDGSAEVEGCGTGTAAIDGYVAALVAEPGSSGWNIRPPHSEARQAPGGATFHVFRFIASPRAASTHTGEAPR